MIDNSRVSSDGLRYPPGFRWNKIYSISFLIIEFGSYGFPRNAVLRDTSNFALAILYQIMGARLSNPIPRQCSCILACRGTTIWRPYRRRGMHTSPTTITKRPRDQHAKNILPYLVEFCKKLVIIVDKAKLAFSAGIFFECPILVEMSRSGERSNQNVVHVAAVPIEKLVFCWVFFDGVLDSPNELRVLCNLWDGFLPLTLCILDNLL